MIVFCTSNMCYKDSEIHANLSYREPQGAAASRLLEVDGSLTAVSCSALIYHSVYSSIFMSSYFGRIRGVEMVMPMVEFGLGAGVASARLCGEWLGFYAMIWHGNNNYYHDNAG